MSNFGPINGIVGGAGGGGGDFDPDAASVEIGRTGSTSSVEMGNSASTTSIYGSGINVGISGTTDITLGDVASTTIYVEGEILGPGTAALTLTARTGLDDNGFGIVLKGADGNNAGSGGSAQLLGGGSDGASGTAGQVTVDAGDPNGGNKSNVNIGTANAAGIYLGNATSTVTCTGVFDFSGATITAINAPTFGTLTIAPGSVNLNLGDSSTVTTVSGSSTIIGSENFNLGFYGASPIAKQTGVGVDAASIHAALVSLGLISA
jgi:hypothetical protein